MKLLGDGNGVKIVELSNEEYTALSRLIDDYDWGGPVLFGKKI